MSLRGYIQEAADNSGESMGTYTQQTVDRDLYELHSLEYQLETAKEIISSIERQTNSNDKSSRET